MTHAQISLILPVTVVHTPAKKLAMFAPIDARNVPIAASPITKLFPIATHVLTKPSTAFSPSVASPVVTTFHTVVIAVPTAATTSPSMLDTYVQNAIKMFPSASKSA